MLNNFKSRFDFLRNFKLDKDILTKAKEKYLKMTPESRKDLKMSVSWFFLTDEIIKKTRLQIQSKMRNIDCISILLAAVGVATNIVSSFLYIDFLKVEDHVETNPSGTVDLLRTITSVTTFLLLISIYFHYRTRLTLLIFKQSCELNSTLLSTRLIYPMIIEILVCMIHSFPYMNNWKVSINTTGSNPFLVEVELDLLTSIIVPWRIYLLFKFYANYSIWADDRAEKICSESNTQGGPSFAFKAQLKDRPYLTVSIILVLSILIFGYGLRNIELAFMQKAPINKFQDWRYIWNGFWCIFITVLTIGYGDYYPQTHVGRALAVLACLWGTFLISLMVVSISSSVDFTPQEQMAYDEIKRDRMKTQLRTKALTMIRHASILKNVINQQRDSVTVNENEYEYKYYKMTINQAMIKYKKALQDFQSFRSHVICQDYEVSTETMLSKINHTITDEMEELVNISNLNVTSLKGHLAYSIEVQKQIKTYTNKLHKLTKALHSCINKDDSETSSKIQSDNAEKTIRTTKAYQTDDS